MTCEAARSEPIKGQCDSTHQLIVANEASPSAHHFSSPSP